MAGCVARLVSQPPPGNDDPNLYQGWTTVRRCMLPLGGISLSRRSLVSSDDSGDFPDSGYTRRTIQAGVSYAEVWPRVISQPPIGYDNPNLFGGETRRTPVPGSGLSSNPLVRRTISGDASGDFPDPGQTRRTLLTGQGLSAVPRMPPRAVYSDDSPPEIGYTWRTPLGRTGLASGPLGRRITSFDPTGDFPDAGQTRRTMLPGTGQFPNPVVPRVRVVEDAPYPVDLLEAGVTWRQKPGMLSNDGQVIGGPYWEDAIAIYQAGAAAGVMASGGGMRALPNPSLLTGLLAYWTLNEASGNRADSTGNGNTLVNNNGCGTTAGFGNVGNATTFNGTNQTLSIAAGVVATPALSIAGWFNIASSVSIIGFTQGVSAGVTNQKLLYQVGAAVGTVANSSVSGGSPTINAWHHLALTNNGTITTLYLDGFQVASGSETPTYSGSNLTQLAAQAATGAMVGWGVYGRVLSSTGIANLYNNGNGVAYSSLGSLAG